MDRDGKKRFVWTTGPYLIQYALAHSSQEDAKKLEDADEKPESPENGLYFLLCNNRWGMNFPQWFG